MKSLPLWILILLLCKCHVHVKYDEVLAMDNARFAQVCDAITPDAADARGKYLSGTCPLWTKHVKAVYMYKKPVPTRSGKSKRAPLEIDEDCLPAMPPNQEFSKYGLFDIMEGVAGRNRMDNFLSSSGHCQVLVFICLTLADETRQEILRDQSARSRESAVRMRIRATFSELDLEVTQMFLQPSMFDALRYVRGLTEKGANLEREGKPMIVENDMDAILSRIVSRYERLPVRENDQSKENLYPLLTPEGFGRYIATLNELLKMAKQQPQPVESFKISLGISLAPSANGCSPTSSFGRELSAHAISLYFSEEYVQLFNSNCRVAFEFKNSGSETAIDSFIKALNVNGLFGGLYHVFFSTFYPLIYTFPEVDKFAPIRSRVKDLLSTSYYAIGIDLYSKHGHRIPGARLDSIYKGFKEKLWNIAKEAGVTEGFHLAPLDCVYLTSMNYVPLDPLVVGQNRPVNPRHIFYKPRLRRRPSIEQILYSLNLMEPILSLEGLKHFARLSFQSFFAPMILTNVEVLTGMSSGSEDMKEEKIEMGVNINQPTDESARSTGTADKETVLHRLHAIGNEILSDVKAIPLTWKQSIGATDASHAKAVGTFIHIVTRGIEQATLYRLFLALSAKMPPNIDYMEWIDIYFNPLAMHFGQLYNAAIPGDFGYYFPFTKNVVDEVPDNTCPSQIP